MIQNKISIVTVVYNDYLNIEKTIKSVLNQTYKNFEYLIIDGASIDGTKEIINKYNKRIDKVLSEKDNGIYDAMNKGLNLATGDWIIFMNSGDVFIHNNILLDIFENKDYQNFDILYGDTVIDFDRFTKFKKAKSLKKIYFGTPFCHQSYFARLDIHKKYLFNLDYKLAADYNFIIEMYENNFKFLYLNNVISIISNNGVSDTSQNAVINEWYKILKYNDLLNLTNIAYYFFKMLDTRIRSILKIFLPNKLINLVRKLK